jgi:hypothetical protein
METLMICPKDGDPIRYGGFFCKKCDFYHPYTKCTYRPNAERCPLDGRYCNSSATMGSSLYDCRNDWGFETRPCKGEASLKKDTSLLIVPEFKTYQEKLDWCNQNDICPDCMHPYDYPMMMCTRYHGSLRTSYGHSWCYMGYPLGQCPLEKDKVPTAGDRPYSVKCQVYGKPYFSTEPIEEGICLKCKEIRKSSGFVPVGKEDWMYLEP